MKVVFEGDTYEQEIEVRYKGEVVDPSLESQLKNCEVVLYSRMDKRKILAKYALRKHYSEGLGWGALEIVDGNIVLRIPGPGTITDISNEIMMQVTNYIPDSNIPETGLGIDTGVTSLFIIKKRAGHLPTPSTPYGPEGQTAMVYSGGSPYDKGVLAIEGGSPFTITTIKIKGNSIN